MTVIPITCDNCGAKYKLPPTFKGSQAKCQKCGSVIDVAKQRAAAEGGGDAKPAAAAKPASKARPAVDRSKARAGAGTRKAAADKPARSARGRAAAKADGEERPRRGRPEKKKDNTPMILGAVGLVLLLGVGGFFLMGGEEKKADEQANTTATSKAEEKPKKDAPPAEAAATDAPASADPGAAAPENQGAAAEEKPAEDTPPPAPKAAEPNPDAVPMPDGPKEPWMKQKRPAQTMADVRSAAELYGEVRWSESIDDATKTEVQGIAEDLDVNGGIRHIRAKRKIVDAGYAGLFAILERLHGLDYRNADDAAFGFELNKMIEEITGGLNARYAAVQAGEDVHPAKAQWNTKTVKAWMSTFAKWPDEAAFKKAKKERAKKNADK
ncbi:MAG: hypothetical protein VXY92_02685 [Planctomycetota bacterium]|nr:hypothetical protein [Planctomycetota bacterium]